MNNFTKTLCIIVILVILFSVFWIDITSMEEVETYSIGMEVLEKYVDHPSGTPVFFLEGSGDSVRLQVHREDYDRFNTGDIVEVKVIKLESNIFKVKATMHTVLGAVIED